MKNKKKKNENFDAMIALLKSGSFQDKYETGKSLSIDELIKSRADIDLEPPYQRKFVWERDTQDDHFDPKSLYSDTRYVAVLCKSCNQKKTNNDLASASQLNTYIQTYPEKFEEWFNTKYKKSA